MSFIANVRLNKGGGLDLRDLFFLLGAAAAVYGASLWSIPIAWILGGAIVCYLAVASAPAEVSEPEPDPKAPRK